MAGKKKVLVIGGAGFIGSNLCEQLSLDESYEVYSLDNYFTGKKSNHVDGVIYIEGNSKDVEKLVTFIPDIIYHLGEYSRVEQSFDDISILWDYNKTGTFAVLEFTRKTKAKLIYAGSSTKFSQGCLGKTQSPYAWIKASNSELIQNYGEWFGISYAIVYFYNVYGNREISSGKYATLIGLFSQMMKEGKPLTVVSPGIQKRNFTHVDDIVNGLILVGKNGYGNDFGIGSLETYSVLEIAKMFGGDIEMLPQRKGNRVGSDLVISKTQNLGWKVTKRVDEYIEQLRDNNWQI